ncbi:MAG: TRAP transporter large permease [Betaproteobacteria bacterium]|jgi:C4-dicarboxylate transporter DctM subunit|nr:TRAP transporter large permease [Betaproteobacteria bacterium]MDH5343788.1 TRAP transporter large permease [Betaproteobacteria bacterium]
MFDHTTALALIASLLLLVALGVHIAIALGMTSALGIYLVTGDLQVVANMLGSTAYESLRDYVFAVIPLFMLMGEFIGKSGAVTDVYRGINRGLKRLPGRLGIATVLGNAIFSFVTGVSIASAATFSRVAYPEMRRFGYNKGFALGAVAGSSCLGMLIPPSVLMIVWGILTEQSIGQIFLAGVLPGLLLTFLFVGYIFITALLRPAMVGGGIDRQAKDDDTDNLPLSTILTSFFGILVIVFSVLGGIWFGVFTPTEAAGAGAFIGLVLGIIKGMRYKDIIESILSVGRTSAPILLLLVAASLYSRTLAMTGVTSAIQDLFLGTGLSPLLIIVMMVIVWFLLGMVIDSISIMLLTVPIFAPIAMELGYDPIAFAIVGILAIESGLLTPPFGLLVYTVKAAIQEEDPDVSIIDIFKGSMPYWIIILLAMILILEFPQIATYLPSLMF